MHVGSLLYSFKDLLKQFGRMMPTCGAGGFKLKQRALHVFAEAGRVVQFRDACNKKCSEDEKLARLGQLMDESQDSCR